MTLELGEPLMMDAASWSFGIHRHASDASPVILSQQVGPWLHDHRGRTSLASIGVLAELAMGLGPRTSNSAGVMASITVSITGRLPATGMVTGRCEHVHRDATTGTSVVGSSVLDAQGEIVMRLVGRAATVDRPRAAAETAIRDAIDLRSGFAADPAITRPDDLAPIDIVREMISAPARRGAYARHVGLSVDHVEPDVVRGRWTALPWTTNPVGGVQGGVLLGVMSTVIELGAEAMTEAQQVPRLAELHVDMLRSPSPELGELTYRTSLTRKGRRFGNLDATLHDRDGRLIAQARGTALFVAAP